MVEDFVDILIQNNALRIRMSLKTTLMTVPGINPLLWSKWEMIPNFPCSIPMTGSRN